MCDSPETSREHAPPLCFFPELAEIGRDLRRNLVTVPSCADHNSKKSNDDEFFRAVILMTAAQNSDVGRHQFFQKLLRGVQRSPRAHRTFFSDKGAIAAGTGRAVQIDRKRFDTCIDHLVRALFFDTFGRQLSLPITIVSPNLFAGIESDHVVPDKQTLETVDVSRQFLGGEEVRGENPEVFKYRVRYVPIDDIFAFAGIFYDCFEIFSFSSSQLAQAAV